jgi:hypothetical protein
MKLQKVEGTAFLYQYIYSFSLSLSLTHTHRCILALHVGKIVWESYMNLPYSTPFINQFQVVTSLQWNICYVLQANGQVSKHWNNIDDTMLCLHFVTSATALQRIFQCCHTLHNHWYFLEYVVNICKGKGKVKLSLCLTKHHAKKMYWGVEV